MMFDTIGMEGVPWFFPPFCRSFQTWTFGERPILTFSYPHWWFCERWNGGTVEPWAPLEIELGTPKTTKLGQLLHEMALRVTKGKAPSFIQFRFKSTSSPHAFPSLETWGPTAPKKVRFSQKHGFFISDLAVSCRNLLGSTRVLTAGSREVRGFSAGFSFIEWESNGRYTQNATVTAYFREFTGCWQGLLFVV